LAGGKTIVEDKRIIRKAFTRVGIGYGAFLVISLVLQLGIGTLIAALSYIGVQIPIGNWYVLFSSMANYVVGGIVTYLFVRDMPVLYKPQARKVDGRLLIAGFLVCISGLYLGNIIGQALMSLVSALQGKPMINPVEQVLNGLSGWAIFFVMVVMAPICEEILFRKVIIDRIRLYGDKAAIAVSGFIFGLCHGNFYQFFYAFLIGVVFAYIYIQTGKLRYTIVFHMIINFLGSIVGLKVQDVPWLIRVYSIFMLSAVIAGIVLFIQNRKNLVFQPGFNEAWGKGAFKVLFLNFGMVFFFLVSAVTFVISEIS
jgi:membrane protease YdiL (CAAX protease family)